MFTKKIEGKKLVNKNKLNYFLKKQKKIQLSKGYLQKFQEK